MSSHLPLSSAQLDRIEDALEDLELDSFDPSAYGGDDDPVAQRLGELRGLLQLSREALPLEEVPAGLLDGVLAQAKQAASASAAEPEPARASWWSRWRLRVWVPGLAFAGSAALLLLVLGPKQEPDRTADATVARAEADGAADEKSDEASAKAKATDGRLAQADLQAAASTPEGDEALRGQGLAIGERAPDPEPAAAEPALEEAPADDDEAQTRPEKARRASASGSSSAGALPKPAPVAKTPARAPNKKGSAETPSGPTQTTTPTEAKKDEGGGTDLWPEITRADADRRGGNCGLARMRYDKARTADDARVRARALAGLGLCEAADGSMSTANKRFAQARAADPGVSGFIDGELAALDPPRASPAAPAD